MRTAIAAVTAAIAMASCGPVAAYPLADRVLACEQIGPNITEAYTARMDGIDRAVAVEVFVFDPTITPAQRWIVNGFVGILYDLPVGAIPSLERFQISAYTICVEHIGDRFMDGHLDGAGLLDRPNRREQA